MAVIVIWFCSKLGTVPTLCTVESYVVNSMKIVQELQIELALIYDKGIQLMR